MDYRTFAQKSDEILENMTTEELRYCLHEIARKMPEGKRRDFLHLLKDGSYQRDEEHHRDKGQYKRLLEDDWVKEKLEYIKGVFAMIENGEICLSAQGYEDYSHGYWASEWIWEYEDYEGVGRIIEDAVIFAYDCVNDRRYEEAVMVFELLIDATILAEDEYGGDYVQLGIDEMVDEGLVSIDLKKFALNTLYSEYQFQPIDKRVENMYVYFDIPYFKGIHIEDILSIGREELKDTDIFFQSRP